MDDADQDYDQSTLEKFLLLHNMFALAARFSTSQFFADMAPADRGNQFADKAKLLYRESLRSVQTPTLEYLQGCTLLAFYLYLSGPNSQGWLMIGTCSRLAYDLGIDKVDSKACKVTRSETPLEWRKREEFRRVWWAIWELDTFASAISCRSHTIDRSKAAVKLPVSDENWFADLPVESVLIDPNPLHAWHTLRDCPNQDERAWFLLSNYLLLVAHDLAQHYSPKPEDIRTLEKAVACFVLLLPPHFHFDSDLDYVPFNSGNQARCNWIVCTNLMIQGYCSSSLEKLRSVLVLILFSDVELSSSFHAKMHPIPGI
jgi:Fungal specific transcription factor domain